MLKTANRGDKYPDAPETLAWAVAHALRDLAAAIDCGETPLKDLGGNERGGLNVYAQTAHGELPNRPSATITVTIAVAELDRVPA